MLFPAISCYFLLFPAISCRNSAATQLQLSATQLQLNRVAKHGFEERELHIFGLSCTLQLTATQSPPTSKKHCKTRANQCKSLQLTSLKNHRKKDPELQPPAVLDLSGGRPPPLPNLPPRALCVLDTTSARGAKAPSALSVIPRNTIDLG